MKIIPLILLCSLFCLTLSVIAVEKEQENNPSTTSKKEKPKAVSTGDKIYTWIDNKGNRIYSDVPREGAEIMEIPKGTNYTAPTTEPDWSTMKPKVIATEEAYSHFEIASPANEATVRNNDGNIQVALDIRPRLGKGHKIKLEVDGNEVAGTGSSIIALNNIDRGSHTIIAYILTADGEVLATTPPVVVHMHRAIKRARSN